MRKVKFVKVVRGRINQNDWRMKLTAKEKAYKAGYEQGRFDVKMNVLKVIEFHPDKTNADKIFELKRMIKEDKSNGKHKGRGKGIRAEEDSYCR